MNVDQIKHHPFFYGVNWNTIRQIEAPFIPRLRSITDTSYFPTDELENVPEEPVGGDTSGANKDLAFLGYVVSLRVLSILVYINGLERGLSLWTGTHSSGSLSHRMRSDRDRGAPSIYTYNKLTLTTSTWHRLEISL